MSLPIVWQTDTDAMLKRMGDISTELRSISRAYQVSFDPIVLATMKKLRDEYAALDEARRYVRLKR